MPLFVHDQDQKRKPAPWLLLVMALPISVVAGSLIDERANLSNALLSLMGWLVEPTHLQRHIVRVLSHLVVPTLIVFALLRTTRLGAWLVPNRLVLVALAVADAVFAAVALYGLVMAANGGPYFLTGTASSAVGALLGITVSVGLGGLAASTLWHRLIKHHPRALGVCQALLQRV